MNYYRQKNSKSKKKLLRTHDHRLAHQFGYDPEDKANLFTIHLQLIIIAEVSLVWPARPIPPSLIYHSHLISERVELENFRPVVKAQQSALCCGCLAKASHYIDRS